MISQANEAESRTPVRRVVLVAGLALLAIAVVLTGLVAAAGTPPVVQDLDDRWYRLMVAVRWPPFVAVSTWLSVLFGALIDWSLRVAATLLIMLRRRWLALGGWVTTLLLSEISIRLVKTAVDRPRPPGSMIATSGASFPSGHAVAAAVTAIGIVMALIPESHRRRWMAVAVVVAALVALSRTYLSAHWLFDVLGGSLIGAGLALAVPEVVAAYARMSRRA